MSNAFAVRAERAADGRLVRSSEPETSSTIERMMRPVDPEPTFETALDQLERIADDLERGEPDLAVALSKYEQAVRLLAHCHGQLDAAERTVALLTGVDEAGRPLTTPFDATATADREPLRGAEPKRSQAASSTKTPQASNAAEDDPSIPF
jgi:exodeoxyribonuclease VII small subunit